MHMLTPILLDAALKAAVILLLAACVAIALRKRSAAARHMVWTGAIVAVLVLPAIAYLLPGLAVLPRLPLSTGDEPMATSADPTPPENTPVTPPGNTARADARPSPAVPRATLEPTQAEPAPPIDREPSLHADLTTSPRDVVTADATQAAPWQDTALAWLPWIWLGGASFALLPIVLGALGLARLKRASEPITADDWQHLLRQLQSEIGLRRPVTLRRSHQPTMPMTWGGAFGVAATVLVPVDSDDWSPQRRRAVLLHELAHVKRYDCLTQMLTQLACAFYWFNPLIWFAAHRMLLERERACDDLVLTHETKASDYAQHLLDIATGPQASFFAAHAGIAMARRSKLDGRLVAILDQHRNRKAMTRLGVALTITLIGAVAVPVACVQLAKREPAERWTKAEVVYHGWGLGSPAHTVTLNDPAEIAELASHFPKLGEPGKQAMDPAGWEGLLTVTFHAVDGRMIDVAANPMPDRPAESVWREDRRGDYLLHDPAELVAFVEEIANQHAELSPQLVGVQPGGVNLLLDRHGRESAELRIGVQLPADDPGEVSRNFVLAWPADEAVIFPAMYGGLVRLPDHAGHGTIYPLLDGDGTHRAVIYGIVHQDRLVQNGRTTVDIPVRYYHGPRQPAPLTFQGPFTRGATSQSQGHSAGTFTTLSNAYAPDELHFSLKTSGDLSEGQRIGLAYDAAGRRYRMDYAGGGNQHHYTLRGLLLSEVAVITVGEPAKEQVIRDVTVVYPERQEAGPWFESPDLQLLAQALKADQPLNELHADQRQQLREIAQRWASAVTPNIRVDALQVGLGGGWPEFLDPAMETLSPPLPTDQKPMEHWRRLARALGQYEGPMGSAAARRLADLVVRINAQYFEQPGVSILSIRSANGLLLPMFRREDPVYAPGRMTLVQCEYPWLWWNTLLGRGAADLGQQLTMTPPQAETFWIRLIAVKGTDVVEGRPELVEQASALRPDIVADPRVLRLASSVWYGARRRLADQSSEEATAAEVALLRRLEDYHGHWGAVLEIARSINRRHDIDLAGVGDHEGLEFDDRNAHDWDQVAQTVIEWYAQTYNLAPAADREVVQPRQQPNAEQVQQIHGRVLDEPDGQPIAEAEVRLMRHSDRQSETTLTDEDGAYRFENVEPGTYTVRLISRPGSTGVWSEGVAARFEAGQHVEAPPLYERLTQSVSGTVTDTETGDPVAGVVLNFSTADKGRAAVETDEHGRYRLFVLPREVEIRNMGTRERYYAVPDEWQNKQQVAVTPGEHMQGVDMLVRNAPLFHGEVVLPDGTPAPHLAVTVQLRWSNSTTRDAERIEADRQRWPERSVVPQGQPADEPMMWLGKESATPSGHTVHLITNEQGQFTGYLRRPNGEPWRDQAVTVDALGRTDDQSLGGRALLETTTLNPDAELPRLRLAPTASATFAVVDLDGEPIAHAEPGVTSHSYEWASQSWTPSPAEPAYERLGAGRFRATGLLPGWGYRFYASAEGHRLLFERLPVAWPQPGQALELGTVTMRWWDARLVPELLEHLKDENRYRREGAVRLLRTLGADAAEVLPALRHTVEHHEDREVREAASQAIQQITFDREQDRQPESP